MAFHSRMHSSGRSFVPRLVASRVMVLSVAMVGSAALSCVPATAESMREALGAAYQYNPEIDAGRARLRAGDEDVQRARAGWGPQIGAGASVGIRNESSQPGGSVVTRPRDLSVQLTQPLFTGLRTFNDVNVAEAGVRAGRAALRDVEARVLAAAAQAYADVQRDRAVVRLAERFVKRLAEELDAARERRSIGEVTLTDVDQTRNRLAGAKVALSEARGTLRASESDYVRLVGRAPSRTSAKGIVLGAVPATRGEATAIAHRESPIVAQALYLEQAARYGVDRERAELLPRVDLEAGYRRAYNETEQTDRSDTAELIGRLQVPLYQGGEQRARVRQAKHIHVGRLQDVETARRQAEGNVGVAWAALTAAREQIALDRERISFATAALMGVRDEERVGQRTLLDVLNAEEELFEARISFEQNFRNMVVAHYEVLRAMGRLDSGFLKLAKVQYDPEQHYFEARDKWLTTSIGGEKGRAPADVAGKPSRGVAVAGWRTTLREAAGAAPVQPATGGAVDEAARGAGAAGRGGQSAGRRPARRAIGVSVGQSYLKSKGKRANGKRTATRRAIDKRPASKNQRARTAAHAPVSGSVVLRPTAERLKLRQLSAETMPARPAGAGLRLSVH